MKLDVFSIFPEYLAPLRLSLIGKAIDKGLLDLTVHDLREFTHDRHRTVDDTPYGGGAGMVMRPEPWGEALESVLGPIPERPVEQSDPTPSSEGPAAPEAVAAEPGPLLDAAAGQDPADASGTGDVREGGARPILLVPSPSGTPFTQAAARELAHAEHIVVACGRYEGIDQRVMDAAADIAEVRTYSIGDYVLNGGEVATMVMVEAIARLIPGVIGNPASLTEESYEDDLLEYPVYTKPATWKGHEVPPILLSGNHAAIERWRRDRRLERTSRTRPDLLSRIPAADLDKKDRAFLASLAEDPSED